jgi:hypothetical protein
VTLGQTYAVGPTLSYRQYEFFTTSTQVQAASVNIAVPGGYSAPHPFDLDRDSSTDLLVGAGNGQVYYYHNTSSSSLTLQAGTTLKAGGVVIDVGERAKPFVVDWNNDNCPDLLVGNSVGQVWLYLGSGNCQGTFNSGSALNAGGSTLTVTGGNSAPMVVDWDGDHNKDLVVGAGDGNIYLFLNTSSDSSPVLGSGNALLDYQGNALSSGSYATPVVYDFDRKGYADLLLGGGDGTIGLALYSTDSPAGLNLYNSIGTTMLNDVKTTIDVGSNSVIGLGDINGDNQFDGLVGNSAGAVYYFQSSHLVGDLDRSGKVDAGDLILLNQSTGLCKGDTGYNPSADLNGSTCVDATDQSLLVANFGKTY